jgi:hypothetical protein
MPDANGKPLRADRNTPNPLLSNTAYDVVKDTVTLGFPAAVTLYAGLAVLWSWPNSTEIVASAGLVGTFLGVLLKIASKRYENLPVQYDGALVANDPDPEKDTYRLEFDSPLAQMGNQDEVRLKVIDLLPEEFREDSH